MKKTISLVMVFVFILALAVQSAVLAEDNTTEATGTPMLISANQEASSSLERILSPDQIKLFEKIKKVGDDLFGVRKAEMNQNQAQAQEQSRVATNTASASDLEKIPSPEQIKLFEKIKKIGNDLFGVRKANMASSTTTTASSTLEKIPSPDQISLFERIQKIGASLFGIRKAGPVAAVKTLPVMSSDLITCTASAIDAKDSSLSIALTDATTKITTAIESRGTCQKAALALTSGREDAIKVCNQAFQETTKAANEEAKKTQQEAWTTYKTDLKACSTTASTTEINIEDGGEILNQ